MSLYKNFQSLLKEELLIKKEDPHAYAKLASTGFILAHPVKIGGQEKRHDNNIPYHATIKFFDKEGDDEHKAHEAASKLDHQRINPQKVNIGTKVLKDRNGNDVYSISLHGPHADKLKEHHDKLAHLGHKETYEWGAHISVPKIIFEKIKNSGAKNAHDAGIEFGHAELRRGPKTLHTYKPKVEKSEQSEVPPLTKPYSSEAQRRWAHTEAGKKALGGNAGVHEWDEATKGKKLPEKVGKTEQLEKGAVKNALTGVAMGAALAAPHTTDAKHITQPSRTPASIQKPKDNYSSDKVLNAISQVESSGGKNTKHKPTSMGTAYGKFALMPSVIQDTIRLNPDLKQHKKALKLQGEHLNHYMQDNPELEHSIAQKHLQRLEHHFGHNPEALAFGWNQGVTGTNKALKAKQNISEHPYVQKFNAAYKGSK
jgi:hypothetical protein